MRPAYLRFGGTEADHLQYVMGPDAAPQSPNVTETPTRSSYPQPDHAMNITDLRLLFNYFSVDGGTSFIPPAHTPAGVDGRASLLY